MKTAVINEEIKRYIYETPQIKFYAEPFESLIFETDIILIQPTAIIKYEKNDISTIAIIFRMNNSIES